MRGRSTTAAPSRPKFWRHFSVRFGSLRFYLALAVIIIGLHTVDAVVVSIPTVVTEPDQELATEFKKKQLDLWSEMNKLLIAFATVTIGAIGGFMVNRDKTHPLSPPHLRRAAMSWFFCALSLYFGYLSYQQATQMLKHGVFDPFTARLWWPARGQFWSFLVSIILFGDFIYTSIRDKGIEV
ncbi:MAG TPA: hypothetical protein VG096_10245 [Bryobacteraceae bacterium]|jgi:hypothetical protein|nr:hypothetical protein [Bryobacteraceae bacterium]